ncbi:glycerol kinase GlpK [Legionella jamestowniensis]|uniref:glycerol kinase n=1 Tax=Legionella jamestowniensis TaxID=455 RepID=A0A0W0UV86_9GAMM|nr:glycerol kinase GlpK [Legionella jamestowniensis]KTD11401.1 glycerol kinase [Legionella jamestowniensis]OCH98743.1 glycerol kinase [Legionella jamestowniensis]SFL67864.1 glycerol kinase [Legionella jamestowniensis DSM 19215]
MSYLLAIDQGTSSTRAIVYDTLGKPIATSQYILTQFYPNSGWVEHDPEEIWSKTLKAMQDVVAQVKCEKILACGITNQRETTVIWDKTTGQCLAPAIVWQDRRTEAFCQSLSKYATLLQEKTGLLPDPYFSASKLHWLLESIPEARALAAKNQLAFGTMDTFLLWRLTNGQAHLTDVSNASRTLLFNIIEQQWDDELLALFKIPISILPEVCASDAHFGEIDKAHLGISIPITGIAGDQQSALIGQRCFYDGMTKATFGTGGFLLMNTGEKPVKSSHKLLTTIAYRIKGKTAYGLEGSLYHAGTTVKWLRDEMKLINTAAETETLAMSLESNEGVYLVPSFTGLGAPHWISTPGAAIVGLSRTTNRAHFARASLEAVCYQTRDVLDCMRQDSNLNVTLLRVDGGMAANQWFLQYLASQCQVTVQQPVNIETTAQGAAMLAAIGCGVVNSLDDLQKNWQCQREFFSEKSKNTESDYAGWNRALRMVKTK